MRRNVFERYSNCKAIHASVTTAKHFSRFSRLIQKFTNFVPEAQTILCNYFSGAKSCSAIWTNLFILLAILRFAVKLGVIQLALYTHCDSYNVFQSTLPILNTELYTRVLIFLFHFSWLLFDQDQGVVDPVHKIILLLLLLSYNFLRRLSLR